MTIYVATTNAGKLLDFAAAAAQHGVTIESVPGMAAHPAVPETGSTFAENARLKSETYSRLAPGHIVIADDSGLQVDALGGAPGVHSARYAALRASAGGLPETHNSPDEENNTCLLRDLDAIADAKRTARFVCVISAAQHGKEAGSFRGVVEGTILRAARGSNGFGYDPLFLIPELGKTTAELTPHEKARVSHRGRAFRDFLAWATGKGVPQL